MNFTIPLVDLYAYVGALIVMRSDVGAEAFDIDNLAPPPRIAAFYDRVRTGPILYDGKLAVLFYGNVVGITTDQDVANRAMAGCADCKRLRAKSLAWAYSLWRFWIRKLVDWGFRYPELDHAELVRSCTASVPRHNAIRSSVPFEDVGPAPFVPEQPDIVIDIDSSDEDSSDESPNGTSNVDAPAPVPAQYRSDEDIRDAVAVENMMVFEGYYDYV